MKAHFALAVRVVIAVVLLCPSSSAWGQQTYVSGRVTTVENTPLPLTPLVLRDAATGESVANGITDGRGDFRIRIRVPSGRYYLVARRIGLRPDSASVATGDGGTDVELRLAPIAINLAAVRVEASPGCSDTNEPSNAAGALMWDEFAKGIEQRREINRTYRYEVDMHRLQVVRLRFGRDQVRNVDSVYVQDPRVRSQADTMQPFARTAREATFIRLLSDSDLLSSVFLAWHCRGTPYRLPGDSLVVITFEPRSNLGRDAAGAVLLSGTVMLDARTWRTRRIEYRYLHDGDEIGRGLREYIDRQIDGAHVALTAKAVGASDVPGAVYRILGANVSWDLTFGPPRDVTRLQ
jgi:hypothetical protein